MKTHSGLRGAQHHFGGSWEALISISHVPIVNRCLRVGPAEVGHDPKDSNRTLPLLMLGRPSALDVARARASRRGARLSNKQCTI